MAGKSADHLSNFEQQLTCPVCLELFNNPKSLPCLHTFCQDCLGNFSQEVKGGIHFLTCPSCREPALVPDGGVCAFPPAFTINSFLELHQQMLAKQDTMECDQHKRPLDLFCNTCQELLCVVCQVRSHKHHNYHLISDIIHDCKQEVKKAAQPVKEQLAAIMGTVKVLEACDEEISQQGEDAKQQICSHAQEARAAIDQAEKELLENVDVSVQKKKHVIFVQKEEAKEEQLRLQNLLYFVEHSLATQSDQQIMASNRKVVERLNEAVSQKIHTKFYPLENAEIKFTENSKTLEHCKSLGKVDCCFVHDNYQLATPTSSPGAAGKESCCELRVQHKDGSTLSISSSLLSFRLTAIKDPQPANCIIKETCPGTIAVSYTPLARSSHELRVLVGGAEIAGSPLSLPVLPPTPETRGEPLHVAMERLMGPLGVAVNESGDIVVSERSGDCIKILSSDFKLLKSVGSHREGDTQFSYPLGLAITNDECILVADSGNHRIQVLTPDGQFLKSIGSRCSGPFQFECPTGIAVHPTGKILVSDSDNHRIQVLNANFTFSHSFGSYGSQPKEFYHPRRVAVDSQGMVYIADWGNSRIQKFNILGRYKTQFIMKDRKKGQPCLPVGIAIDAKDLVYVSEPSNDCIWIFTSNGKLIKCLRAGDQEHPILREPNGLALDKSGNLYVCNELTGQLVVF